MPSKTIFSENDIKIIAKNIKTENLRSLINFLNRFSTSHANTPKTDQKRFIIKELIKHIYQNYPEQKQPESFLRFSETFTSFKEDVSKELGVSLLPYGYSSNKKNALETLIRIADDPNWEVREYAGGAFSLIAFQQEDFYRTLLKLTKHSSVNVKRAVLFAAIGLMKRKELTKAFDLLEPLLYENHTYIKKNLGPFILGSYLGNNYPKETFSKLNEWIKIKDEHVRWNLAMTFNNSFGNKYPDAALKILKILAKDESKTVRRSIVSTLRSLRKRNKNLVNDFLKDHSILHEALA